MKSEFNDGLLQLNRLEWFVKIKEHFTLHSD
jgi:hypothetical protein